MDSSRPRSSSQSSNQELSPDNVQVRVSINPAKEIKLNVRPDHTVNHVLEFLSASTTLPADVHLLQDGKQLAPQTTVSDLYLTEASILTLDPPTSVQSPTQAAAKPAAETTKTSTSTTSSGTSTPKTPKKSNRPRCTKDGCKAVAQPIVGDCGFCGQRYCGKHRMLESHNCSGLDDARQADKDRNAAKLEQERTVMLRGL